VFAASVVALDARIERLFQPPSRVSLAALILFPALLLLMPVAALGFWQSVTPVPIVLPLPPVPSAPQIVDAPPLSIAAAARPGRTVPVREQPTTASFQTEQTTPALEVRVDQLKGSDPRTVVLVTVYVSNTVLNFVEDAGLMRASGRILTDVTGVDGARMRIVSNSFLVERPSQLLKPESYTVFQVRFDLPPGLYKLDVAYEDDKTGKTLVTSNRLAVVRFPTGLATSSLILAANIEVLPSTTPSQPFHVGNFKIRPSVNGEFRRDEALNFALQIYGLSSDVATIETSIVRYGTVVRSLLENVQAASDMTITKTLSLSDFEPGNYSINVTITDARTGEVTRARADFRVR
jgi:hypothetical protein